MSHAVRVENGVVVDAIYADVRWAEETLGGDWYEADAEVSPPWLMVDGDFRPPPPEPSWTWDGTDYQPPVPQPEPVDGFTWNWDEDGGEWVQVEVVEPSAE